MEISQVEQAPASRSSHTLHPRPVLPHPSSVPSQHIYHLSAGTRPGTPVNQCHIYTHLSIVSQMYTHVSSVTNIYTCQFCHNIHTCQSRHKCTHMSLCIKYTPDQGCFLRIPTTLLVACWIFDSLQ